MTGKVWYWISVLAALAAVPMALGAGGFEDGIPEGWACEGTCGTQGANGVVTLAPEGGDRYGWVATTGSGFRQAYLPGIGGTNGSRLRSEAFSARAGDALEFSFNYVTSDGAGFADYAWVRLLDSSLEPVALLFTARTLSSGNVVPGFGMPDIEAQITPETVTIIGGGPAWSALGADSGRCYASGCGYTGWVESAYTIAEAGNYVLEFGVVNWSDTAFQSGLAFDGLLVGGKPIGAEPDYQDVRVVATLSGHGIEIVPSSFATEPVRVEQSPARTEIEWFFETFSLRDSEQLDFTVTVRDPQPGEFRPVVEQVLLRYRDLAGQEHQRALGPEGVQVLSSVLGLDVETDRTVYAAGEPVRISSSIRNLGDTGTIAQMQIEIQDREGQTVALLGVHQDLPLPAGDSVSLPMEIFDSAGLYSGNYRALARAQDTMAGTTDTKAAEFTITMPDDTGLSASLLTDRQAYQPFDEVWLTGRLTNTSPNHQIAGHAVRLAIQGPGGEWFWTEESPLRTLGAGAVEEMPRTVALGSAPAGTYRAILLARDPAGLVVATAETGFTVASTATTGAGVSGTVSAHPNPVFRSDFLGLSAQVSNRGNAGISDLPVTLALVDLQNEQELSTWSWTLDLEQGATRDLAVDWVADVPAGTPLAAILSMSFQGAEHVLDYTTLRVEDRFATSLEREGRGRVLVLLDGPRGEACEGLTSLDIAFEPGLPLTQGNRLDVELRGADGLLLDFVTAYAVDDYKTGGAAGNHVNLSMVETGVSGALLSLSTADGSPIPDATYQLSVALYRDDKVQYFESPPIRAGCDDLLDSDGTLESAFQVVGGSISGTGPENSERAFLENLLSEHGWSYTVVTARSAFARELRHGGYASFLLLAEQVKLDNQVARELREAVVRGQGIVMAGAHDQRNHHLLETFGVKLSGVHAHAYGVAPLPTAPMVGPEGAFAPAEHPLVLRLDDAVAVAEYSFTQGQTTDRTAVAVNTFGRGTSVIAGFDLLAQAHAGGASSPFAEFILATLNHVQPAEVERRAGMTIPVGWKILNRGNRASLRAFIEVAGGRIVDPGTAEAVGPRALSEDFDLAAGAETGLAFWWQLPMDPEGALVSVWLDLREGVVYREYGESSFRIDLMAPVDFDGIRSQLTAHPATDQPLGQALNDIDAAEAAFARGDPDRAVSHLLRAAERLDVRTDPTVIEIRATIGWLIHQLSGQIGL